MALGGMLAGCVGEAYVPPDPPPGEIIQISGTIDADATWSGVVHIVGDATIAPGVTITVAPDTWIQGNNGVFLRTEGMLDIAGTAELPVQMYPMPGADGWGGITAEVGGAVAMEHVRGEHVSTLLICKSGSVNCTMSYIHFTDLGGAIDVSALASIDNSYFAGMANAGIGVNSGGDLTINESYILTSDHDLIVTNNGSRLTVDRSEVGGAQGSYEHCNVHIGAADYVSITNSNLISSIYAMMIGNTDGAIIQYNNIIDNDNDIDPRGPNANVDMRYNYWSRGVPNNLDGNYDLSSPATELIPDAGPTWEPTL